jgi:glutaredoxin-like protein
LPGDPFEVSDADTMLNYINPNALQKTEIAIFTKHGCSHCTKAKALLAEKGLQYEEMVLGEDTSITAMRAISQADTTPQIFIDGQHIGGNDELTKYFS